MDKIIRQIFGLFILLIGLILLVVLATHNPTVYEFYPKCPTVLLFKIQCFFCGATRSLYELLHGNIIAASQQNIVFVLVLPLLIHESLRLYLSTFFDYHIKAIPYPSWFWKVLFVVLLLFMIWRNV